MAVILWKKNEIAVAHRGMDSSYADRLHTPVVILRTISANDLSGRSNCLRYVWLYQEILLTLRSLSGE